MKSRFLSAAEEEFMDAAIFYEKERRGLGDDFIANVLSAVDRLQNLPLQGTPIKLPFRSLTIRRFPFNIIYKVDYIEIVIIAVAHHRRRPGYWKNRTED